eukprot:m51a1_g11805 hypothetical protein (125) ;mRNA; r:345842-346284
MAEQEVTKEDQASINAFGRLTVDLHEIEADIAKLTAELENVRDAQSEALLVDPEPGAVKYLVGEAFVEVDPDAAVTLLQEEETRVQGCIEAAEGRAAEIKRTLAELKVKLYAKFGRANINLEED